MDDLAILRKETGLGELQAEVLLEKAEGDVVSAIMLHQGEDPFPHKKKDQVLTDTQQKIQQLRDIVDRKDEMMDAMIQAQREQGTNASGDSGTGEATSAHQT